MGQRLTLTADDGHSLGAYRADASGTARGGIVVLQEIFGVNVHIRDVCDRFAADGFTCIAPALYDRSSHKDCELGYEAEDMAAGRKLREEFSWDDSVRDVAATVAVLSGEGLKVGSVGYCWGGTISFLAGVRLGVSAAVVYYGGQIIPYRNERARCPMLMHFGEHDAGIPLSDVEQIRAAQPEAAIHIYDAGHGFNCDRRGSYDEASAKLARQRTIDFFGTHLG
ncbi:MAG: dienelactone hydrolase family protein [Chromatiales bacterium]|nr:dienelactone hydrolase family protein [Chromatiales bacterium]